MTTDSTGGFAAEDLGFQAQILQRVSRTFALTIPELPDPLRHVVGNAYLLCRIADTIEDEPALSLERKTALSERFVAVVAGACAADGFARDLAAALSPSTSAAERDLAAATPRVVRITHALRPRQRRALERCVGIMTRGMVEFQLQATRAGLRDVAQLDRYCYCVAGVVAEMLAELFCDYSVVIDRGRDELMKKSVSYGQGLQLTNILKDIWGDLRRGACWLPRSVFDAAGFDLQALAPGKEAHPGFERGLDELVAVTRRRLAEGLEFILLIPAAETGIRRHLLWTLGLSVLTLRRLHATASFRNGREIALPRWNIRAAILLIGALGWSDSTARLLFHAATRGLPRSAPPGG